MELEHIAARQARLSAVLREDMGLSAGLMNRLKWQNKLFVNAQPQRTDYMVKAGDVVRVPLDDPEPEYPAEDGLLTVLYEDAYLLAVDKPAGMLIHPSRSRLTGTLANRVLGYYRRIGQHSAFHPVTRLDRDTFGIVLLAKNAYVHMRMNALHDQGAICKIYHARTFGGPPDGSGTIDAPIARKPLPSLLRQVCAEGKPSVTRYRVLSMEAQTAKLELQPITGRTHQLRVHCAYKGWPILGDPQYGSAESGAFSKQQGLQTQLLCAKRLEFPHPVTGQQLCLESQMDV